MSNVTYFLLDCQLPEDQTWLCWQLFSEVFTIPWFILSNHVAAAGKNKAPETIILIKWLERIGSGVAATHLKML